MEETGEPSPPFAIVLSNLWIAYGFIQTVLERRPGDVHRLVRVVIEFQQVREQKGLCYSIYSYGTCHDDTGYFGVYTALGRETEGQALDTILAVIREPTEHGVTQAELDRAREQSKANVLMGLESAQSHMSSLGRGEVLDEDAIIAAYDAVTRADVQALAGELFRFENASLSAVEGKDTVKAVTVGGVACTEAAVLDGSYAIQRPFVLVTKGGTALSPAAQAFFVFAASKDAASLIQNAGAVPTAK